MLQNGWYCCPHCGQKQFKINKIAYCTGVELKCKGKKPGGTKCGELIQVDFNSREPLS